MPYIFAGRSSMWRVLIPLAYPAQNPLLHFVSTGLSFFSIAFGSNVSLWSSGNRNLGSRSHSLLSSLWSGSTRYVSFPSCYQLRCFFRTQDARPFRLPASFLALQQLLAFKSCCIYISRSASFLAD